ncbi:ketoacyl-ACP synthase III [Parabacteroides bouchesdurhonensis]|uniref:ketoacyl-ACP synthase III n=1 Tax=Parabacteroides bouchesdurhonensis TaxID=1936995 RepID=UPI000E52C3C2|nr:ketoacyl-ACP synthase III [Parabacteroides bouchesdurhonensis]RHJ93082.1 ketoacyl-ACP synthase III [Bacteroides sp. AM07-16]
MNVYIKAISYYLPEHIVTNEELVKDFPEWNVEKVAAKTGISKRHIAGRDETAGDMAVKAANKLFEEYDVDARDIDFILLCTQSPDYFLPTTACLVQEKLGVPVTAGAMDYNLGCSGYIYGLAVAKGLISANIASNVLLLTTETYNKYIHPKDKGNRSLFGDGAAATLVSDNGFANIGEFVLGTDGCGAENLIVRTGAARERNLRNNFDTDEDGHVKSADYLYMNGSEIFNFTLETVPSLVNQILIKNKEDIDSVDKFIFHQANKFMLSTIRKVCQIPKDKFYVNLENTGNTVSSTIPIALKDSMVNYQKEKVMLVGFGVGYSWGGCLLDFDI